MAAEDLRAGVHDAFSTIAERPDAEHPIPVGRALAEAVGYPAELLASTPRDSVDAFAGVTYLWGFADVPPDGLVLDLGCGAGLDLVIASRKARAVVGVDFSEAMLRRARAAVAAADAGNVELRHADAEAIPLEDGTADCALVNGIFNLNLARQKIFGELARVLRPGASLFVAELIRMDGAPPSAEGSDWFS